MTSSLTPASVYAYGPRQARDPELEILLTDGLGGFAMSSLAGVPTRCYSGLAVSHQPPVARFHHLISPLERLQLGEGGGPSVDLHSLEIAPGIFEGQGLDHLTGAAVWDLLPEREQLWRGVWLRRRMCMPQHSGALVVTYEVRSRQSVTLTLGGFFVDREMHEVHSAAPQLTFNNMGQQVRVMGERETRVTLHFPADPPQMGVLHEPVVQPRTPQPFVQRVYYRADAARGERPTEVTLGCDLWDITFPPGGGEVAVVFQGVTPMLESGQTLGIADPWVALASEATRRRHLAERAWQASGVRDDVIATLAVAADAYLVRRGNGLSIIAGYPWFADWGRDAMVSLSGLLLVTGRPEEAQQLLTNFLGHLRRGLLPNHFDEQGEGAGFNTVDAALWLIVSIERYARMTGNGLYARQVLPVIREILKWYAQGTDYGIQVDPEDGLLRSGASGLALTWMDIRIHDWVVTPRSGKPVEIQALWLASLGAEVRLAQAVGDLPQYAELLEKAHLSFKNKFWPNLPVQASAPSLGSLAVNRFTPPLGMLDPLTGGQLAATTLSGALFGAPFSPHSSVSPATRGSGLGVGERRRGEAPSAVLADGLQPDGTPDTQVRPNAVIALALADTPAVDEQIDLVIAQTEAELLTPMGLHSLSPRDPQYLGNYGGPQVTRDAAYHQGTIWPWPLTSYIELLLSRGELNRARAALSGLTGHIWEAGIGHISEVFSGDTLQPGGCPFQAWSVAEFLRAHVLVSLSEQQRHESQAVQDGLLRG